MPSSIHEGSADSGPAVDPALERPRQERAQATLAAILRAAASIFAQRGYSRTTLDVVAVEAGVTKGALYFHFDSKHALANAVIAEGSRLSGERAAVVLAVDKPALASCIDLTREFTRQLTTDAVVAAGVKLTTEELVADLDIEVSYVTWIDLIDGLLRRAIDEGDVSGDIDPATTARYVVASFTGVQMVSNSLRKFEDVFDRVHDLWVILLRAIVVPARLADYRELLEEIHR